jgi:hypothetical protein
MKNYLIINTFIFNKNNSLNFIFDYLKKWNNSLTLENVKYELSFLIKKNILFLNNNLYELTKEGNVILNDNKNYYSKIIYEFIIKKYSKNNKKFQLKEIRMEQKSLRNFLIEQKNNTCVICEKKLPYCLLETAHLKPRCLLSNKEKNDYNVVEFMCRYCHNLYDNGYLSINNNKLYISPLLNLYDLKYEIKDISCFNLKNEKYFSFHFKYIFKK